MKIPAVAHYAKLLEQWENIHCDYIETLALQEETDQEITLPKEFLDSDQLHLYKLKKRKCEVCFYAGGYKFIRSTPLTKTPCMVFLICESCWLLPKDQLPCQIDQNNYLPMNEFLERLYSVVNTNSNSRNEQMLQYRIGEVKLEHTIGQLHKIISRWEGEIAKRARQQIKGLANLYSQKTINKAFLLKEEICGCDDCCYCDYFLEGESPQKKECAFRQLKLRQDHFLRQFQLYDQLVHRPSTFLSIEKQMDAINNEVEMVIIRFLQPLEEIIQRIISETKGISLTNEESVRQLEQKYRFYKTEEERRGEWAQMEMKESQRCWKSGIVNHLTCENLQYFDQSIDCLQLKYARLPQDLIKSMSRFKDIGHLRLSSSSILAELLNADIQALFSKLHTLQVICPIPNSFLSKLKALPHLNLIYLNGNMLESFENYHQKEYFPQAKIAQIMNNECDFHQYRQLNGKIGSICIGENTLLQPPLLEELEHSPLEGLAINKQMEIPTYLATWKGTKQLTSIYLDKIIINEGFSALLQNCECLKALSLNSCTNMSSNSLKGLSDLQSLRKLALIQLPLLPDLPILNHLTSFILQRCFTSLDGENSLFEVLESCRLRYLSLYQCIFLDDDLLVDLLSKQSEYGELQALNLGQTSISQLSIESIGKFKLEALNLGGTLIDPLQMVKDLRGGKLQNLRGLQRLNLKHLKVCQGTTEGEYFNDVFSQLLSQFPLLSHLDISYNPLGERALRFNLQCLTFLKAEQCYFSQPSKRQSHYGKTCLFFNGRQNLKPIEQEKESASKKGKDKQVVGVLPEQETYIHLIV